MRKADLEVMCVQSFESEEQRKFFLFNLLLNVLRFLFVGFTALQLLMSGPIRIKNETIRISKDMKRKSLKTERIIV